MWMNLDLVLKKLKLNIKFNFGFLKVTCISAKNNLLQFIIVGY